MTIIAAIKDKEGIHMAGDSSAVGGYYMDARVPPKIFLKEDFLFGYTTSFRMGQLIQHVLKLPDTKDRGDESDLAFLVQRFIPKLKKCLKKNGYESTDSYGEEGGGTFLMGFNGELYKVENDYNISVSREDFSACGCGRDLALGSLYSTKRMHPLPDWILL